MMPTTSQDGRIRELFIGRETQPAERPCPASDAIWAAVSGELPPADTAEVVDHTAACAACAESWRLASALAPSSRGGSGQTVHPRGRSAGRRLALAGLAAALALAAIGLPLRWSGYGAAPVYRGGEDAALTSTLDERCTLPRDAFQLAVTGGAEDTVYHFVVTTVAGDPVFETEETEEPTCRVPPSALTGLPDGAELAWYASGVTPAGERLESALQIVILGPPR